ncbi:hypothetical protein B0A48_16749 [Cryoendolithus antarcticus]|uniref:NmrA-like domain-containing protein n=1 Tax=Cryoendolithus antarcticus TaxID=1507870 RepID=A0A1V8SDG9_9PEZI|nr:hypothetical protein B0A48_16749 [Cryoendolithus antarcticus]
MLVIVGASGKLGFATLTSLLDHQLLTASQIAVTSSSPQGTSKLQPFISQGVTLHNANWDDPVTHWTSIFKHADAIFLISSARIQKDFHDAPPGHGREADHFNALEGAKAAGVKHVYYTSLAFANPSKSGVMTAHERTEAYLIEHWAGQFTIIREGLYSESWLLYFGHWDLQSDGGRSEVITAGDGKISWTSIADLGVANALILAAPRSEWAGRTVYLSQEKALSLAEVAKVVSEEKRSEVAFSEVSRDEHEKFYVKQRGMDEGLVTWWSKTYAALKDGECEIHDSTLEDLLAAKGVKPKPMEETIHEMLR